jgi:hypothetical protein
MKAALTFTGIEVREVRGVGWSVVTTWAGKIDNRLAIQADRSRMNRVAEDLYRETSGLIEDRFGAPPYLLLAEAPGQAGR